MKPELDRVKNDLATMEKALGAAPFLGRDWTQWIRRDNWLHLGWCLPGLILIASTLLPPVQTVRYLGLLPNQWIGVLTAISILGLGHFSYRRMMRPDGRPEGLMREYKKINAMGMWFLLPFAFYLIWAKEYHLGFEPYWSGLWILSGVWLLLGAITSRVWVLLGWALPALAYGLTRPLFHDQPRGGVFILGSVFIAAGVLSFFIQIVHLRALADTHDAN